MQLISEILRLLLVLLQIALIGWVLAADLWRKLPMWTLWLGCEIAMRALFAPGGHYWHWIWLPMQPASLFLLGAAAMECRYHAGESADMVALAALLIAPIGVGMDLQELGTLRVALNAGLAVVLSFCRGSETASQHARIMALVCAATAACGWMPATGAAWWRMRAAYLAVYCVACALWLRLFTREA